ncbi:MAG: protein kinase [Planctomycetota bacterium]|nr:protein kinase [Planctomycetota bacterium]
MTFPLPGSKLGPYEVTREIGRGGMGVVYLARDPKLDREVAIKVLPEQLTRDTERVLRFEREAKLLASLNHTNVAAIHGFEECDGKKFLVLEYVEGETLAAQIKRGALPVDEALEVCKQIAEALEAAHEKGIIHRDLKPANVMVKADGTVKVLDFGLARAMADDSGSTSIAAESPTITADFTKPGVVLGTAPYMSPEQARGRPLDKRTDIWSFGVILYECLTGSMLFHGETATDSMGAIMHRDPDWTALPLDTPPTIRLLLRRCLAKDRRHRLQAIGDARVELEDVGTAEQLLAADTMRVRPSRRIVAALPWVFCCVLAMVVFFILSRRGDERTSQVANSIKKSVLTMSPDTSVNWRGALDSWSTVGFSQLLAISRDGRRLILTVQEGRRTSLYLKDEEDFIPSKVTGTDDARGPFFSTDGLWVGFLIEGMLWKVRLPGGTPQPICEVNSAAFDATWLDDGTIIYSSDHGLRRVSADGGESQVLTSIDVDAGVWGHHFPHVIPGTRSVIFTVTSDTGQHAALLSLDDSSWKILKRHATDARYIEGGYLVFARNGELLASSYDPADPMMVGTEASIVRGVHTTPGQGGAVVHLFATSQNGVLVYAPQVDPPEPDALVWVDHEGNEEEIVRDAGYWMHQRLSRDGERILFNSFTSDGMLDLYIYDFQREQINPLTHNGHTYDAEWSPDGQTVCFNSLDTQGRSAYLIPTDFSGPAVKIIDGWGARPHLCQWSADGSTLVFFDRSSQGGLWTTSPSGQQELRELMNSDLGEAWAQISPNGQLIAYVGWEADRRHVYIRDYPDLGPRIRVSKAGGGEPLWAHDSRTLYYREDGKIFKASIVTEPSLNVTQVATLPIADLYDRATSGHQHYDLSTDSTKFLMVKHGRRPRPTRVHIIENWAADLKENSTP